MHEAGRCCVLRGPTLRVADGYGFDASPKRRLFSSPDSPPSFVGAWRSPVAHLLWEQGVGGSNPLAPTSFHPAASGAAPPQPAGRHAARARAREQGGFRVAPVAQLDRATDF